MPRLIPSFLFAALVVSGMVGAARAAPLTHPLQAAYASAGTR